MGTLIDPGGSGPRAPLSDVADADRSSVAAVEEAITEVIDAEQASNPDWPPVPKPEKAGRVAKDVVKKAGRLIDIVATAAVHGVRVRYFSTDAVRNMQAPWRSEGLPGVATIINAVEVTLLPTTHTNPALSLYLSLRLTEQNRRSLATFLWDRSCPFDCSGIGDIPIEWWDETENLRDPWKPWGVLIWSDGAGESCLVGWSGGIQFDLVPWEHVSLMTAPHHGSKGKAHKRIWQARAEFRDIVGRQIPVLLAGGMGLQQTTEEYVDETDTQLRSCTRCRHLGDQQSKTVVAAVNGPTVTMTPVCRR
jgi:hypothetical protein